MKRNKSYKCKLKSNKNVVGFVMETISPLCCGYLYDKETDTTIAVLEGAIGVDGFNYEILNGDSEYPDGLIEVYADELMSLYYEQT